MPNAGDWSPALMRIIAWRGARIGVWGWWLWWGRITGLESKSGSTGQTTIKVNMTNRTGASDGNEASQAPLRKPHVLSASLLTEQIRCGQQLGLGCIERPEQLAQQRRIYTTWCAITADILRSIYSHDGPCQDFLQEEPAGAGGGPWSGTQTLAAEAAAYRVQVERKIGKLEALVRRIGELGVEAAEDAQKKSAAISRRVLIVHGQDAGLQEQVVRLLTLVGLEPLVLHDQATQGRFVLQAFDGQTDMGFAVVVLTPDDVGASALRYGKDKQVAPRAEQNVVFELGFLVAKLKPSRVLVLHKPGVEVPGDCLGVLCVPADGFGGWRMRLAKELRGAGYAIDLDKLV
jgi:predicted nucleotide-binding protein